MSRMRDRDARAVLLASLGREHRDDPDTRIIEELGIDRGDRRVDVAVVNGSLHGFEIKSDADTLDRLPGQSAAYSGALDLATLVTAPRHVEHALAVVPEWWGITLVEDLGSGWGLVPLREAGANPSRSSGSLAQFLWRDELVDALTGTGSDPSVGKLRRRELIALASALPVATLAPAVRSALKGRQGWRAGGQPS